MLWSDLRFAFRTLRKSPTFTLVAVSILAVGIGGIATAFSVVDTFLLNQLPYRDAANLVHLYRADPQTDSDQLRFSLPMVDRLGGEVVFDDLGAYTYSGRNISGGANDPEHVTAAVLTDNLLEMLGAPAALGRGFVEGDGAPGGAPVVLLDWGLWQRRYAGATDAIGRTLYLDGQAHEIVGVMPADFDFPYGEVKAWTPISRSAMTHDWEYENYQPVGRLAAGYDLAEAREALQLAYRQTESDRLGRAVDFNMRVVPLREALLFLYDQMRLVMMLVLVANAFVLLIICTNLAGLLIGRAVGRTRETAIRGVLGASRAQIVRQLLTEGSLLALGGGALGLALAAWQVRAADAALPEALFRSGPLSIDGRAIAVTLGAAVATTLLFALLPALQASRGQIAGALKDGARQAGSGRGVGRIRGGLVVVQVASAVVLLVGTGLMVRTVAHMQEQDLGFATDGVLTMGIHLPESEYVDDASLRDFQRSARERLTGMPGIAEAAFVQPLPLNFASHGVGFEIEGRPAASEGERLQAGAHWITPGYFDAMDQSLLQGRSFAVSDRIDSPAVIVVNRSFAERWWPDVDPVGQRLRLGGSESPWTTVVGVVADSKSFFASDAPRPLAFIPMAQRAIRSPFLVVRTEGAPHASFPAVRDTLAAIDSNLPLSEVRSMQEVVDVSMLPWRGTTSGLLVLAGLALFLAILGIYGVVSFASTSRTGEIGIRRAMGAQGSDVLQLVLGGSALLVGIGITVGLLLGVGLSQLLSSLLFGIEAHDPWTYAAVALLLALAAGLAALVPTVKALRVDPIRALRYE